MNEISGNKNIEPASFLAGSIMLIQKMIIYKEMYETNNKRQHGSISSPASTGSCIIVHNDISNGYNG